MEYRKDGPTVIFLCYGHVLQSLVPLEKCLNFFFFNEDQKVQLVIRLSDVFSVVNENRFDCVAILDVAVDVAAHVAAVVAMVVVVVIPGDIGAPSLIPLRKD